jgi:hypothetical protein
VGATLPTIATVGALIERLETYDPTSPLRIVDPSEHVHYVTAVGDVATDPATGWSRGVWLRISGGVEPGRHPFAPRDVWTGSQND